MAKLIVFLFCAFLVVTNANVFAPRDLIDEIEEHLHELQSIVQGQILVAHDNLGNMQTDFTANSENLAQLTAINIQEQQGSFDAEVTSVKGLAAAAGVDSTICTNVREDVLYSLPATYINETNICLDGINLQAFGILVDARYRVDIVMNKVGQLEFQLTQCRGSIECASPLDTEIALDKIRLPQNIGTEVQATDGFLTILRLSVQSCSNDAISEYVSYASSIVRDIEACINRLLE